VTRVVIVDRRGSDLSDRSAERERLISPALALDIQAVLDGQPHASGCVVRGDAWLSDRGPVGGAWARGAYSEPLRDVAGRCPLPRRATVWSGVWLAGLRVPTLVAHHQGDRSLPVADGRANPGLPSSGCR
jgi:hypothetical protein